jgi:hypothetical protein
MIDFNLTFDSPVPTDRILIINVVIYFIFTHSLHELIILYVCMYEAESVLSINIIFATKSWLPGTPLYDLSIYPLIVKLRVLDRCNPPVSGPTIVQVNSVHRKLPRAAAGPFYRTIIADTDEENNYEWEAATQGGGWNFTPQNLLLLATISHAPPAMTAVWSHTCTHGPLHAGDREREREKERHRTYFVSARVTQFCIICMERVRAPGGGVL